MACPDVTIAFFDRGGFVTTPRPGAMSVHSAHEGAAAIVIGFPDEHSVMIPNRVTLVEVGPRDGLQNEKDPVATAHKVALVQQLAEAGLREIEVTSFVSPKWVPQMADNAQVMAGIVRRPGVRYSVLTPNMKGLEAALPTQPDEIVVFGAASEAFSQRNINCSIAESIERFVPVVSAARMAGVKVRAAVSCALGCPYQGEVSADEVEHVVKLLKAIGVQHCGIADTIGVGTPKRAQLAMERALRHFAPDEVSGHFHDTYGQALANIYACLEVGVSTFDASVAGLGGCPYAKGATGNVATEDVVFMLNGLGIHTGVDLDKLVDAGAFISGQLGRAPVSRVARAVLAKRGRVLAS
jgi:hydroxymethylglutaryl-CoA lyase